MTDTLRVLESQVCDHIFNQQFQDLYHHLLELQFYIPYYLQNIKFMKNSSLLARLINVEKIVHC